MLRTVHFDNQLCRSAVKIHDKSADDPLFVNLHRVLAEKEIPELAFIAESSPCEAAGRFPIGYCLLVWSYFTPLSPASPPAIPKGEPSAAFNALHRKGV